MRISTPPKHKTAGQRALYYNLNKDEELTLDIDTKIKEVRADGWRDIPEKESIIKEALRLFLTDVAEVEHSFTIIKQQPAY